MRRDEALLAWGRLCLLESVTPSEWEELTDMTQQCLEGLATLSESPTLIGDPVEKIPSVIRALRGTGLLKRFDSAQCLGVGLFKPMLPCPNPSLQPQRASQKVRVTNSVRLGSFNVGVGVVKSFFPDKELRQGEIGPK